MEQIPPLKKQLEDSLGSGSGAWYAWNLILIPFYPLSLLQMIVFWFYCSKNEAKKADRYNLLFIHFGVMLVVSWLVLITADDLFTDPGVIETYAKNYLIVSFVLALFFLLVSQVKGDSLAEKYEKYYRLVWSLEYTHVRQIADKTGDSPEKVELGIEFMIQNGFLPFRRDESGELFIDADLYDKYGEMAKDPYYENVREIAEELGRSTAETIEVIQAQIDQDGLPVWVNECTGEIGYADDDDDDEDEDDEDEDSSSRKNRGPVSVQCEGCGARMTIDRRGETTCSYCGSALRA